SDADFEQLVRGYQDFYTKDFTVELKKYPIEYLLWDKTADPDWHPEQFFHDRVYDANGYQIYRIV
ncbi:MAG TPA: hypothetical protein VFQ60_02930, partial [Patescibacteria group bacterium]|nr:hypothetical protein [Patescibacteria group bacterium]